MAVLWQLTKYVDSVSVEHIWMFMRQTLDLVLLFDPWDCFKWNLLIELLVHMNCSLHTHAKIIKVAAFLERMQHALWSAFVNMCDLIQYCTFILSLEFKTTLSYYTNISSIWTVIQFLSLQKYLTCICHELSFILKETISRNTLQRSLKACFTGFRGGY